MRELVDLPIAPAIEKLFARAETITPLTQYHGLFTLFAMAKAAVATGNARWLDQCKAHLDKYPDNVDHPGYSFELYRIGGIGKAFLFHNGEYGHTAEEIRSGDRKPAAPAGQRQLDTDEIEAIRRMMREG